MASSESLDNWFWITVNRSVACFLNGAIASFNGIANSYTWEGLPLPLLFNGTIFTTPNAFNLVMAIDTSGCLNPHHLCNSIDFDGPCLCKQRSVFAMLWLTPNEISKLTISRLSGLLSSAIFTVFGVGTGGMYLFDYMK